MISSEDAAIIVTTPSNSTISSLALVPFAVISVAGESITNTQVASVDEGDIVKRIGEYLLVFQDGRVFAVHCPTLQLTDRQDFYRTDERGRQIRDPYTL